MTEEERITATKHRERMMRESVAGTPRYLRARRFADTILHLMRDFIPQDRECRMRTRDFLLEAGFASNAEVISVPPECDALDKLALEKHMLKGVMARAGVSADPPKPE